MTLRSNDLLKHFLSVAALLLTIPLYGAALPGFRAQQVAPTLGFVSSIVADSHNILYYTATTGEIYRVSGASSTLVAKVSTYGTGNAGLLGMALLDDNTGVVHYTTPEINAEVISKIDLTTGAETKVVTMPSDPDMPNRAVDAEHHGGNPVVGPDGSIYFGLGDYFGFAIAADPRWIAGKIYRIKPDGTLVTLASGFRNPFDLAYDAKNDRLIIPDNGDAKNDEINVVPASTPSGFYGWPYTAGTAAPYPGAVPPIYTWPSIVAPTGVAQLTGANCILKSGYLIGGFVTRGIGYVPDIDARPLPDPILLITKETMPVVDVIEAPSGDIYFASGSAIYKLVVPQKGDCNADGLVDFSDIGALDRELADGDPHSTLTAQEGLYAGSWGCDVNGDGVISSADEGALWRMFTVKVRAVRR